MNYCEGPLIFATKKMLDPRMCFFFAWKVFYVAKKLLIQQSHY